jgi:hypothetical protein
MDMMAGFWIALFGGSHRHVSLSCIVVLRRLEIYLLDGQLGFERGEEAKGVT